GGGGGGGGGGGVGGGGRWRGWGGRRYTGSESSCAPCAAARCRSRCASCTAALSRAGVARCAVVWKSAKYSRSNFEGGRGATARALCCVGPPHAVKRRPAARRVAR